MVNLCTTAIGLTLEAKLRVQGRECIVKVSPADEDYAAIGGWVRAAPCPVITPSSNCLLCSHSFRWCFQFARVILRFGFVFVLAWHVSVEWWGQHVEQQDETTLLRVKEALWDMHIRSYLGRSSRRMTWTRSLISEQRLMKLCHFDATGIFAPQRFLCLQSQAQVSRIPRWDVFSSLPDRW